MSGYARDATDESDFRDGLGQSFMGGHGAVSPDGKMEAASNFTHAYGELLSKQSRGIPTFDDLSIHDNAKGLLD